MRKNSHVGFLGEPESVMASAYPTTHNSDKDI